MADRRVDELARQAAAALDCQILHRLGQGGMAIVVLAREASSGREVALKVLTDSDERTRERFQREGQILAGLPAHESLVRVHRLVLEPVPALALDYVKGQTLLERLKQGELSEAEALALIARVADGLAVAQTAGLIHRDIKPANILLTSRGAPVLTDFGVALGCDSRTLTKTGETVGTPAYMAPEQIAGDRAELSPATDVWALGVVLFECLGQTLPFPGRTVIELIAQICTRAPRPLPVTVSEPTRRLLERALEKEPADRFPDAATFAAACRAAAEGRTHDSAGRGKLRWVSYALITLAALIVVAGLAVHVRLRSRRAAELQRVTLELARVEPQRDKATLDNLDQAILAVAGCPSRPPLPSPTLSRALDLRHRQEQLATALGRRAPKAEPAFEAWLTLAETLHRDQLLTLPRSRLADLAAALEKRPETRSSSLGLRVLTALHDGRPLPRSGPADSPTVQTALDGARLCEELLEKLEGSGGAASRRMLESLERFRPRRLLTAIWRQNVRHRLDQASLDTRRRLLRILAGGYWQQPELHEAPGRPWITGADIAAIEQDFDLSRHPELDIRPATRLATTLFRWCEVWPPSPAPAAEDVTRALIRRLNLTVRQGIDSQNPTFSRLMLRFLTAISRHDLFSRDMIVDGALVYSDRPIPLRPGDARSLIQYWQLHEAATWLLLPTRGKEHRQRKRRCRQRAAALLRELMTDPPTMLQPGLRTALGDQVLNALTSMPEAWPGQPSPPPELRLALVERARAHLPQATVPYHSAAMLVEFETDLLARLRHSAAEIDARRQSIARELKETVKASPPARSSRAPFFLSGCLKHRQLWAFALLKSACKTHHEADIREARAMVLNIPWRSLEVYTTLVRSLLITDGPAAAKAFLADLPVNLRPENPRDEASVRAARELVDRAPPRRDAADR